MNYKKIAIWAAAASAVVTALPAAAAPILFDLTGSRTATFTIDTNTMPTTQTTSAFGTQISYAVVPGTFNGTAGNATVGFATGNIFADLNITGTSLGFTQFVSPGGDLFSLVNNRPVFNLGTFNLTSIVSGNSTLRISAAAAVPEPATWGMLLFGFGALGGILRYGKATARFRFA